LAGAFFVDDVAFEIHARSERGDSGVVGIDVGNDFADRIGQAGVWLLNRFGFAAD
jgi:hypothetical protein